MARSFETLSTASSESFKNTEIQIGNLSPVCKAAKNTKLLRLLQQRIISNKSANFLGTKIQVYHRIAKRKKFNKQAICLMNKELYSSIRDLSCHTWVSGIQYGMIRELRRIQGRRILSNRCLENLEDIPTEILICMIWKQLQLIPVTRKASEETLQQIIRCYVTLIWAVSIRQGLQIIRKKQQRKQEIPSEERIDDFTKSLGSVNWKWRILQQSHKLLSKFLLKTSLPIVSSHSTLSHIDSTANSQRTTNETDKTSQETFIKNPNTAEATQNTVVRDYNRVISEMKMKHAQQINQTKSETSIEDHRSSSTISLSLTTSSSQGHNAVEKDSRPSDNSPTSNHRIHQRKSDLVLHTDMEKLQDCDKNVNDSLEEPRKIEKNLEVFDDQRNGLRQNFVDQNIVSYTSQEIQNNEHENLPSVESQIVEKLNSRNLNTDLTELYSEKLSHFKHKLNSQNEVVSFEDMKRLRVADRKENKSQEEPKKIEKNLEVFDEQHKGPQQNNDNESLSIVSYTLHKIPNNEYKNLPSNESQIIEKHNSSRNSNTDTKELCSEKLSKFMHELNSPDKVVSLEAREYCKKLLLSEFETNLDRIRALKLENQMRLQTDSDYCINHKHCLSGSSTEAAQAGDNINKQLMKIYQGFSLPDYEHEKNPTLLSEWRRDILMRSSTEMGEKIATPSKTFDILPPISEEGPEKDYEFPQEAEQECWRVLSLDKKKSRMCLRSRSNTSLNENDFTERNFKRETKLKEAHGLESSQFSAQNFNVRLSSKEKTTRFETTLQSLEEMIPEKHDAELRRLTFLNFMIDGNRNYFSPRRDEGAHITFLRFDQPDFAGIPAQRIRAEMWGKLLNEKKNTPIQTTENTGINGGFHPPKISEETEQTKTKKTVLKDGVDSSAKLFKNLSKKNSSENNRQLRIQRKTEPKYLEKESYCNTEPKYREKETYCNTEPKYREKETYFNTEPKYREKETYRITEPNLSVIPSKLVEIQEESEPTSGNDGSDEISSGFWNDGKLQYYKNVNDLKQNVLYTQRLHSLKTQESMTELERAIKVEKYIHHKPVHTVSSRKSLEMKKISDQHLDNNADRSLDKIGDRITGNRPTKTVKPNKRATMNDKSPDKIFGSKTGKRCQENFQTQGNGEHFFDPRFAAHETQENSSRLRPFQKDRSRKSKDAAQNEDIRKNKLNLNNNRDKKPSEIKTRIVYNNNDRDQELRENKTNVIYNNNNRDKTLCEKKTQIIYNNNQFTAKSNYDIFNAAMKTMQRSISHRIRMKMQKYKNISDSEQKNIGDRVSVTLNPSGKVESVESKNDDTERGYFRQTVREKRLREKLSNLETKLKRANQLNKILAQISNPLKAKNIKKYLRAVNMNLEKNERLELCYLVLKKKRQLRKYLRVVNDFLAQSLQGVPGRLNDFKAFAEHSLSKVKLDSSKFKRRTMGQNESIQREDSKIKDSVTTNYYIENQTVIAHPRNLHRKYAQRQKRKGESALTQDSDPKITRYLGGAGSKLWKLTGIRRQESRCLIIVLICVFFIYQSFGWLSLAECGNQSYMKSLRYKY